MDVLLVMRHPGVASLAPTLRLLSERGHHVRIAYAKVRGEGSAHPLSAVLDECPGVTAIELPQVDESSGWPELARRLRLAGNYLRYLEPPFRNAPKLRSRAAKDAPPLARRIGKVASRLGPGGVAFARRGVESVERCVEPSGEIVGFLREQSPDVLLVAHVLILNGGEADYLRAAARLGVRTAFPVRGWDNLTNKGLIRDAPDRLLVWNDLQAREAEVLHGIPRERIRITGSPKCDPLFAWTPRRSREEFCALAGLRPDRPIVLYVGSSPFVAPKEVGFVQSWIAALRAHGGLLEDAGILVRPHPLNGAQWEEATLDEPQVTIWPRAGEAPNTDASRDNYFDSIHHAGAVVGINTTAQIESAILGRPVHTVLAEEFRKTQGGTLHFEHLRDEEYGHVLVTDTLEAHAAQLEASLRGEIDPERDQRFLRRFVRPLGLDVVATGVVVDEIEELARQPAPAPLGGPALGPVVRRVLAPFAARAARDRARRKEARRRKAVAAA
jgi:hypothetical protein